MYLKTRCFVTRSHTACESEERVNDKINTSLYSCENLLQGSNINLKREENKPLWRLSYDCLKVHCLMKTKGGRD